ncbi:alpha/beta hydrolase [Flagellimonas sp. CMM7]|uniref:alpha/beta hydrolase n=1 Tax=Flagellimonas sp. CMM7 TaxID=2654676 RepID=UPI0013D8D02B|nr:CocE/NonD family hydrolase [Flagellimonas sp. CMM7]UII78774.1 acetylxylan esterase [Flagellimonas sp. CMM7]
MTKLKSEEFPPLVLPENVKQQKITVWSLGVALDADIYVPKNVAVNQKLPAIVASHGLGGDKHTAERYAAKFAASGMIVVCFTLNSWKGSQGMLIPAEEMPEFDENEEGYMKVKMVRELVDPIDWIQNMRSVVDYLEGEPNVDAERIGLWGSSYGGGIAAGLASTDERIKVLSLQVPMLFRPKGLFPIFKKRAIQVARGEAPGIPQGTDAFPFENTPNYGTPHYARMLQHRPEEYVKSIDIPTLIIDAANEEMFNTKENGEAAHKKLKEKGIETYYEILPDINHYGIYFDGFERGSQLALDWFLKHL